jgi:hypothetical protein
MRVRNHAMFPSLANTDIVMLNGDYTETEGDGSGSLTLIPPSMFGPPEKIHIDQVETTKPGLVVQTLGKGKVVWVPWDIATLYYRHSLPAHAGILRDLLDNLLPSGRQVRTNAHPLVEMSLMRRPGGLTLHLVNLSGHSQTAYFPPVPMTNIRVAIDEKFTRARSLRSGAAVAVKSGEFVLPRLEDYDAVVLD